MARCFVIQPFDRGGAFDKRYRDVLVPAIKEAGLDHYRVDEDPGTTVLIDDIEAGVRASDICLADITNDNPIFGTRLGLLSPTKSQSHPQRALFAEWSILGSEKLTVRTAN
jgi:hypothetical protein